MKKLILFFTLVFALALTGCKNNAKTDKEIYAEALGQVNQALASKNQKLCAYDEEENNVKAVRCIVYYLELLYSDEAYVVSENPTEAVGNYVKDDEVLQYNTMAVLASMNKENNKITCEAYGDSHDNGYNSNYCYIYLDIDYDFENSKLLSFDTSIVTITNNAYDSEGFHILESYKDGSLKNYSTTDEEAKVRITSISETLWPTYLEKLANKVVLEHDFSETYTKVTNEIMGENFR